jgi:hypothetical protein
MQARKNATRLLSRREASAFRAVVQRSEWEFYEVPEVAEGRALSSSRFQKIPRTRPVGAARETTEGIEILFFPDWA